MDLNKVTGRVLRYGVYLAMAVMAIGAVVLQFDESLGNSVINVGVALLVLTPFFSIIASAVALYSGRDFTWLRVALAVLFITGVGILVAFAAGVLCGLLFALLTVVLNLIITALSLVISPLFVENGRK